MLSKSCPGWHRPAPATCSPPPRDTAPVALLFTDREAEVQVTPGHRPGWSVWKSWPGFVPAGPGRLSSPDTPAGSAAWVGGDVGEQGPQWVHLPACPHFLLHQGPGNARRSLRRECARNVLPAHQASPTPHPPPRDALLSLCGGGWEGLASWGSSGHWGGAVFTDSSPAPEPLCALPAVRGSFTF